jgi:hypothetical protein
LNNTSQIEASKRNQRGRIHETNVCSVTVVDNTPSKL